jgi:Zn finger protein HypA/HybF involved in hydrogenase expression
MRAYLLACCFVAIFAGTVAAAEEFFVVQNPKSGQCKVSNKKDDGQNTLIGTAGYATVEEAKVAKAAAPECNEGKNKKK